jgi:tRNA/tmRNA/rRNA uracil-C5-methylase (TrmA/RlmC/RlmD family)
LLRTMSGTMALIELHTGAIAAGGGCVARADDGRVVFVRHALPGERVMARITAETSSFLRADAVEILDASPQRVEPPCPYAGPGRCGGCDWQHVDLAAQRTLKASLIAEQLRRLADTDLEVTVEEVPGAPTGLAWRTHVRFAVDRAGQLGLRRHRSHDIEPIDRCLIATPEVESLELERLRWPGATEVDVRASADGARVVSVSSGRQRLGTLPRVESGLVVDGRTRRQPNFVHFEVLDRSYRVTAGSFWQVHPGAAALLATVVLDVLEPKVGDHVLDLYAGVGLFTALLGDAVGTTGSVLAVERDRRACADAVHNVAGLEHVEIHRASVSPSLVADHVGRPDLVVLDPAREGAGKPVMAALAALSPLPRRIVYVSCDPASFARDLRVMLDAGWTMPSLRAFDLFPMTEHVELVGLLEPPAP